MTPELCAQTGNGDNEGRIGAAANMLKLEACVSAVVLLWPVHADCMIGAGLVRADNILMCMSIDV